MIPNPPVFTVLVTYDINTHYTYLQMKIMYTSQHTQVMNMHPLFSIGIQ